MKDFNRPIIEGDSINFDNIFYFIKHIVQSYYKFAIFLLPLFFLYKFTQTPNYSSSISFYSNYEKSNQIPSSLGFITGLTSGEDNQLGFSISDYINSERFASDVLKNEYEIKGKKITLYENFGNNYNSLFSINPIGMINKINRHFRLADNLSQEDKKFLYAKEVFLNSITYSEDKKTSLHKITISVSQYPSLSQQIAESAFKSIIAYSTEVTNIKGKEKRKFIEGRLLSVKADLEGAENQMQTFLQKNKDLNSPLLLLKKDRIERNINLYTQLYLSLSDQLELAKIDEKDFTSSVFLLDNATLSSYKDGRSLLESFILILVIVFIASTFWEVYRNRKRLFL
tara:strand:- start:841 stop:1863 length:1023 start_codon:yes stop_codon:yes gene_type:complete